MPFGSDPPVEGMHATQARGARLWLVESIGGTFGEALRDTPTRSWNSSPPSCWPPPSG
jgi:hypothetical protein